MPQQQTGINTTILAMLTEQGRKLDAIKSDFDKFRDELPDDYAPRRETDKAFADKDARINDHEARLRIIESKIPNVEFSAYKDTSQAREKAQNETATARFMFDERTVTMLWAVLIVIVSALVYHYATFLH